MGSYYENNLIAFVGSVYERRARRAPPPQSLMKAEGELCSPLVHRGTAALNCTGSVSRGNVRDQRFGCKH